MKTDRLLPYSQDSVHNKAPKNIELFQLIEDLNNIIFQIRLSLTNDKLFTSGSVQDLNNRFSIFNKRTVKISFFAKLVNPYPQNQKERMNDYKLYFNIEFSNIINYINFIIRHSDKINIPLRTSIDSLIDLRLKNMGIIVQTVWWDYEDYEKYKNEINRNLCFWSHNIYLSSFKDGTFIPK